MKCGDVVKSVRIYVRTVIKYFELFELAGFAVVSPHLGDDSWPDLEARLRDHVAQQSYVLYAEKDDSVSVNFIMIEILPTGRV